MKTLIKSLAVAGSLTVLAASANAQTLVAFRTGTTSGTISYNSQSYSFSSADAAEWGYSNGYTTANPTASALLSVNDEPLNNDNNKSWLGFTGLFGNGSGQIAIGSTINSAVLRLTLNTANSGNPTDSVVELHRVVNDANDWFGAGTTNTWRYLDKTSTASWKDAADANTTYMSGASSATASTGTFATGAAIGTYVDINVTGSLSSWAASATGDDKNMGWSMWLTSAANAIAIASPSNTISATYRPTLFVSYDAIPEPSTWALLALSLTTVMVLRRRRQS